jgi:hypothetical protein
MIGKKVPLKVSAFRDNVDLPRGGERLPSGFKRSLGEEDVPMPPRDFSIQKS